MTDPFNIIVDDFGIRLLRNDKDPVQLSIYSARAFFPKYFVGITVWSTDELVFYFFELKSIFKFCKSALVKQYNDNWINCKYTNFLHMYLT